MNDTDRDTMPLWIKKCIIVVVALLALRALFWLVFFVAYLMMMHSLIHSPNTLFH